MPIYTPGKLTLAKTYVEGDLNYSNVTLLLHGDGTNGSTTIVDSSPSPKTVTAVGNAQISTAIADPFGNSTRAVLAFDGAGDYLTIPAQSAFELANDNFTIEAFIRVANLSGFKNIVGIAYNNIGGLFFGLSNSNLSVYGNNDGSPIVTGSAVTANVWSHIALTKNSGVYKIWHNGVNTATSATNNTSIILNNPVSVGAGYAGLYPFNGYIDELRITKGIARYQSTFTPPTAPFVDAQY